MLRLRFMLLVLMPEVTLSGCGQRSDKAVDTTALRAAVARQASTELALSPLAMQVGANSVRIERGRHVGNTMAVYRLWIARDHWHAYQIGLVSDDMITLGGFQNPDLVAAASHLVPRIVDDTSIRRLAEELAVLADDYGGVEYHFARDITSKALLDQWTRNYRRTGPAIRSQGQTALVGE